MNQSPSPGSMTTSNESAAEATQFDPSPPSNKLRWLNLAVGGTLLALLVGSGALSIRFLREMHAQQQSVTHALAARTQMLSGLWLAVQSYNEAVRQFVTQTEADREQATRQHLDELTLQIDSELKRYPNDRDSTEAALLDWMQDVFSQQRTLYVSVLAIRPDERRRQAQDQDSERTVSLQKQILDWSGKLQRWNGHRLQHVDEALVVNYANLQRRFSRALLIGFGSGLLLVLGSMAYIVRLERQTRQRYVQLARSQRELQRLSSRLLDAQETERRSISRELHDEIGQTLGALRVDLGRLTPALSNDRPEVRRQLEDMKSTVERTFQSVRNISLLLRPSMLDDLGLVAALEWQAREVSRRSQMEVDVQSEDISEDMPDEYKTCIYRLVQEALNNAARHAFARGAHVTVRQTVEKIIVVVRDDGRGFDPQKNCGMGMLGMRERVTRLGGTLTIESQPGRGTALTAELPVNSGN